MLSTIEIMSYRSWGSQWTALLQYIELERWRSHVPVACMQPPGDQKHGLYIWHYHWLPKGNPWAEHLSSLPKRRVGAVSAFNHKIVPMSCLQETTYMQSKDCNVTTKPWAFLYMLRSYILQHHDSYTPLSRLPNFTPHSATSLNHTLRCSIWSSGEYSFWSSHDHRFWYLWTDSWPVAYYKKNNSLCHNCPTH